MLDAVMHPLPFSPCRYYACLTQVRKMPRNLRLPLPQYFNQEADAYLTSSNQIQQA